MAVPDFQALMRPVLDAAAAQPGEVGMAALRPIIIAKLGLSDADVGEMLSGGRQSRLQNRLSWAKIHMERAGLLASTRRGAFVVTERGRTLLQSSNAPLSMKTLDTFAEYTTWRKVAGPDTAAPDSLRSTPTPPSATPDELIERTMAQLDGVLRAQLLTRIHAEKPAFFEQFITDLLLAIGYGKGQRERGFVTGRSSDGGIDGIIHEDVFGLDAVYIQAKRYQPGSNVGAGDLRNFVGAMTTENAGKGVFVTTSGFTHEAKAVVEKVTQRIVLIDGDRLAELAVRHNVGVRVRQTYVLSDIDDGYFASED